MKTSEAIERRKSVRKYKEESLPVVVLQELKSKVEKVNAQYKNFRMVLMENAEAKESKMGFLFGAVKINAPYGLVIIGEKDQRLIAGYEGEKMVLELTKQGIGTCWLGTYDKKHLKRQCELKETEEIYSVIAMGIPYDGGFLNKTFREMIGCHKRKAIEEIVLNKKGESEEGVGLISQDGLKEVIEAAIKAPSANNLQPWQVVIENKKITCYYKEGFQLDGGIFLAHLILMLEEKGSTYDWQISEGKQKMQYESETKWLEAATILLH